MKPHIFIAIHYLELGGAETALIGLLQAIDPNRVDVDLFVYSHQGELMKYIPKWVNLLPEKQDWAMFERPMKEVLMKGHLRVLLARLKAKSLKSKYLKCLPYGTETAAGLNYAGYEVSKVVSDINPNLEYDLAISFLTPHWFTLDHVRAKKKICWIHTDYTRVNINAEFEFPMWNAFDHIVGISEDSTKCFLSVFPSLSDKIIPIENILPKIIIEEKSKMEFNGYANSNGIVLLSVGRICEAKNYDNIPYMARELKDLFKLRAEGLKLRDFKWYIVGPGDHSDIDKLSEELGVKENVVFLGPSTNPYPYIKNCDIYVHPSRYEGKSIVVREAQTLYKPVVVTNYPTAHSQINDGIDGVIVPLDNKGCACGLADFIVDTKKQKNIVEYLQTHDYAGMSEVNKIYDLL